MAYDNYVLTLDVGALLYNAGEQEAEFERLLGDIPAVPKPKPRTEKDEQATNTNP